MRAKLSILSIAILSSFVFALALDDVGTPSGTGVKEENNTTPGSTAADTAQPKETPKPPPRAKPQLTIESKTPAKDSERTSETQFTITATLTDAEEKDRVDLVWLDSSGFHVIEKKNVDAAAATAGKVKFREDALATLANKGPVRITAFHKRPHEKEFVSSEPALEEIRDIDTIGPKIRSVDLLSIPDGPAKLAISFDRDDIDRAKALLAKNYRILASRGGSDFSGKEIPLDDGGIKLSADSRTVYISLLALAADQYQLRLHWKGGTDFLTDDLGNPVDEKQVRVFTSFPSVGKGEPVEFPLFVPRKELDSNTVFNPGDKVETRVCRLYYMRDAHKVAEIINRNVRSLNQAGVALKKREATAARRLTEDKTDLRRKKERTAVRAAQDVRALERELSELPLKAQEAANRLNEANNAINDLSKRKGQLPAEIEKLEGKEGMPGEIKEISDKLTIAKNAVTDHSRTLEEIQQSLNDTQKELGAEKAKRKLPRLISPHGNVHDNTPELVWNKVPGANGYVFRIHREFAPNDVKTDAVPPQRIGTNRYTLTNPLPNGKYRVVISALDANTPPKALGWSGIDPIQSFQVVNVGPMNVEGATRPPFVNDRDSDEVKKLTEAVAQKQSELLTEQRRHQELVVESSAQQKSLDDAEQRLAKLKAELAVVDTREKIADQALKLAQTQQTMLQTREVDIRSQLPSKRQAETETAEELADAETTENRASEEQFRREVSAGLEDPGTYVPGKLGSEDPVFQVSISVIGEGLIHLRGPMDGINKIRTMINQIDTPVGQVKVGIYTVQVNGEHGDRMEKVATKIEGNIDLGRFLTNQSLMYLRRAIREEAAFVANQARLQAGGYRQIDRNRRYLYAFFGRDFIDELYAMDSEFLRSENKLLSIHSMDTVGISQALFVLSLAKNDVRENILQRFQRLIDCEMVKSEFDYRNAGGILPCRIDRIAWKRIAENVGEKYRFKNIHGFFHTDVHTPDEMTAMQREFIRLAQIFKSTMLAELELKQRVIERGLVQEFRGDRTAQRNRAVELQNKAQEQLQACQARRIRESGVVQQQMQRIIAPLLSVENEVNTTMRIARRLGAMDLVAKFSRGNLFNDLIKGTDRSRSVFVIDGKYTYQVDIRGRNLNTIGDAPIVAIDPEGGFGPTGDQYLESMFYTLHKSVVRTSNVLKLFRLSPENCARLEAEEAYLKRLTIEIDQARIANADNNPENNTKPYRQLKNLATLAKLIYAYEQVEIEVTTVVRDLKQEVVGLVNALSCPPKSLEHECYDKETLTAEARNEISGKLIRKYQSHYYVRWMTLRSTIEFRVSGSNDLQTKAKKLLDGIEASLGRLLESERDCKNAEQLAKLYRVPLDNNKLLDFLIDEKEERLIELQEGTRKHIANIDNYLKRLTIAMEDDFKVQFYDPSFKEVRGAARSWDVNLGQIERTTILTNNRAFAKVSPQATMEFDLPKRAPAVVEAFNGARGVMQEYGTLLQDPTFLSLAGSLSGAPVVGGASGLPGIRPGVRSVLPGMGSGGSGADLTQPLDGPPKFGAALEALIPDPAIYKFETGTGFEIRPVIQPDGHSVIFDFDYMYTTNVREPVRADEKHLGRIKRHFIHTEVQTSSFEIREISRYLVALKASRTSRGVPLLEDVPALGVLFRPLPSDESSLQQNIILAETTVYPTLYDLMGLRWSKHVADLDHSKLRELEHVVRGRQQTIDNFVFDRASKRVDDFLGIPDESNKEYGRPDLYRPQYVPSPHHPSGFVQPGVEDSTRREFRIPDRRPEEFRQPTYDPRSGSPMNNHHMQEGRPQIPVQPLGPPQPQYQFIPTHSARDPRYPGGHETGYRSQDRVSTIGHTVHTPGQSNVNPFEQRGRSTTQTVVPAPEPVQKKKALMDRIKSIRLPGLGR